ncbi:DUF3883 domain-containing protein [Arenibaculum pallidiluteum]|uniref:DUF3883 domain-containing protein n=1 Tax=Arenibaculum pallidiluteum TaxID=2812559 RepID=UPI002E289EF6|nr:DUF3883 domain-containing protein [Arenibaculum pallidiluteum]
MERKLAAAAPPYRPGVSGLTVGDPVFGGNTAAEHAVLTHSARKPDDLPFDIRSFDVDGTDRPIAVKTTNAWERTRFHITRNELAMAEAHRDDWRLVRLWSFAREPRAFELRRPLQAHVSLKPTSFQVSLL